MKGNLIKRLIIATLVVFSLSIAPVYTAYANENKDENSAEEEQKNEVKEEQNTEEATENIADPPSGENVSSSEQEVEVNADTPASVTGERMDGDGTVVDFTTSGSKSFYTIVDNEQQVFYLVIDMDKTKNNVYFLSEINRTELGAEDGNTTNEDTKDNVAPTPPKNVEEPEKEIEPESESENNLGFLFTVLIIGGIAAIGYYFLVLRKKQNKNAQNDSEDEMNADYDDDFGEDEDELEPNKKHNEDQ